MSERRWTIMKLLTDYGGYIALDVDGPDTDKIEVVPASDLDRYRELAEGLYKALKAVCKELDNTSYEWHEYDLTPNGVPARAERALANYEAATREPEGVDG